MWDVLPCFILLLNLIRQDWTPRLCVWVSASQHTSKFPTLTHFLTNNISMPPLIIFPTLDYYLNYLNR